MGGERIQELAQLHRSRNRRRLIDGPFQQQVFIETGSLIVHIQPGDEHKRQQSHAQDHQRSPGSLAFDRP
jgi:hypothetical protein